ncbi:M23 family metallopeptidase [Streptomyces bikiniensis]|uniref:M23 family metallopeptidase n=1 Tax=Streptomyces bikiniensis TaxID=1896 RepID=A0ABW8D0Y0_STRBI
MLLAADGIVGPATWSGLVVSVAPGSTRANAVRALQFQLRKHGHALTSGTARLNGGLGESCGPGVAIDGDDGIVHQYCHPDSRSVSDGARVTTGQLVAHTGNTGDSTGPHLHFGIFRQGVSVCPQQLLIALYDNLTPPSPWTLPASGCTS